MPEPVSTITIAGFGLGMLASYLANRADDAQRSLLDLIKSRLRQGDASLPPNHDVERACRQALRQALELLAQAMDLRVVEPKTLLEAISNRYDADGNWQPLFERWHTEEGDWLREFLKEVRSDESLARFNLQPIAGAKSLSRAVRGQRDQTLEQHFPAAMLDWTERRVQTGKQPGDFEQWVREGWPIAPDTPSVSVTLYQAWCLFFQNELKRDENVFRILTVDWLSTIDDRLAEITFDPAEFKAWLGGELGAQRELLEGLRDAVASLVGEVRGVALNVGQLIPLVARFRGELGDGLSSLKGMLVAQGGVLGTLDTKADQVLDNQQRILGLLNTLAVRDDDARAQQDAVPRSAGATGIAESKLLDSDGAARLRKLIGREQEKGLLTRAWNSEQVNVVVFVAWGGVGKTALVTDWFANRFSPHWSGVDAFFDWSFYSQGTRDQAAANSDAFLDAALRHFGDTAMADSSQASDTKARRLAELVAENRTLLILDGVEPLQHPKRLGGMEGRFKDPGLARLLKSLAQARTQALCVVTTREPIIDLQQFQETTARQYDLQHLTVKHGAELLHLSGANRAGNKPIEADHVELLAAAKELRGHALTLQLLGGYLHAAHGGDIRRRDRVDFEKAFTGQLEGHAFNVMEAYERWFEQNGTAGLRQLAALRLTGLFDRPADGDCLRALRAEPVITGLTDTLTGLDEGEWNTTLEKLADHHLLSILRDPTSELLGIDAHPLVREYFALRLCGARLSEPRGLDSENQATTAWTEAHRRLYEHLKSMPDLPQPTLEDLAPLYQAVAHGCLAGLHERAMFDVYHARIMRGNEAFSIHKLGAIGSDLGAVACFFDVLWKRLSPALSEAAQAWLLNEAAYRLRALGRLTEAIEPARAGLQMSVEQEDWTNAAIRASNLSELELTLGKVSDAVASGAQAVTYSDRSEDAFQRMVNRTTQADSLHQAGQRPEAEALFVEAESQQAARQPDYPRLYSLPGFKYCDLLLSSAENAAWQRVLRDADFQSVRTGDHGQDVLANTLRDVTARATQTLEWAEQHNLGLLTIALDHLTLGRAALYNALLDRSESVEPSATFSKAAEHFHVAVTGLIRAGTSHHIPRSLLTRAWLHVLVGNPDSARRDLDEAHEIAAAGPMPLFLADICLHRARLFGRQQGKGEQKNSYPWGSVEEDLAEARRLIETHGYGRRLEELKDTEAALLPAES